MSITLSQISAQVDNLLVDEARLPHTPYALAIAIHSATRPDYLPSAPPLHVRGREFALRWCESELALRAALCECEQENGTDLVLLCAPDLKELADDVAARLVRRRILRPDGWHMVQLLFAAREADARLASYSWMPQLLLDAALHKPYPPVANGFLDLDTAWYEFLSRYLQMDSARPDAGAQLRWSMQLNAADLLHDLPRAARDACLQWLEQAAGKVGKLIRSCIQAGHTGDALALGLACGVLFAPHGEQFTDLTRAQIRLERFVNEKPVAVSEGRAWFECARGLLQGAQYEQFLPALERADQLLRELRVEQYAWLSPLSPLGFDQRIRQFGKALDLFLASDGTPSLSALELAAQEVVQHAQARLQELRVQRVTMALRLARWLAQEMQEQATPASDAATLLCWQADEGAFVDWARYRLLGVDTSQEVSQAYLALRLRVQQARAGRAQAFARALPDWNAQGMPSHGRLLALEEVLGKVVAPLAARHPLLLLVVDGLSGSIFRELFSRPELHGYRELVPAAHQYPYVGVAALPTVPEVGRVSLLCGKLCSGDQAAEKNGFVNHPALPTSHSRNGESFAPRVFHQAELSRDGNLVPDLREALADPKHKALAVVYQALDVHLHGPDQLRTRWHLDDLQLLSPILAEARNAGRLILVCSAHSHVLEDQGRQLSAAEAGGGDRWHPLSADSSKLAPEAPSLSLRGGRVCLPADATADGAAPAIACLWQEDTHFGPGKKGYVGGVSLQEVALPLALLAPLAVKELAEWQDALPPQPEWWDQTLPPATPAPLVTMPRAQKPARKRPSPSADSSQADMFGDAAQAAPPPVSTPSPSAADWSAAILRSSVYATQKALAARVAPPDEQMQKLLQVLDERGGKLTKAALAQRLGLPELRLNGMLSVARRILNVDQSQILLVDEAAATVEINRELLQQQFGLGKGNV